MSTVAAPQSLRRQFRKAASQFVIAVQLELQTLGFFYLKWGGQQTCKPGDWIVNNAGDIYTVDRESFAAKYREGPTPGVYIKTGTVWAEVATTNGSIPTKEGATEYSAGDYLVSNNQDGTDAYAIAADVFRSMYEPVE